MQSMYLERIRSLSRNRTACQFNWGNREPWDGIIRIQRLDAVRRASHHRTVTGHKDRRVGMCGPLGAESRCKVCSRTSASSISPLLGSIANSCARVACVCESLRGFLVCIWLCISRTLIGRNLEFWKVLLYCRQALEETLSVAFLCSVSSFATFCLVGTLVGAGLKSL